jgi:hypothetical protein
MLRKIGIIAVLSLIVAALAAVPALAQTGGIHFTKGGTPVCTISGSGASQTINCTSELAGVGNEDISSSVTVNGFALYTCENQGGNQAPGINKVLEGPTTDTTVIPADRVKNGRVTVPGSVTLTADPTVSGRVAGCPNNKTWTGVNPTLTTTSITWTATQGVGANKVTLFSCTASDPNGLTSPIEFTDAQCSGQARFL